MHNYDEVLDREGESDRGLGAISGTNIGCNNGYNNQITGAILSEGSRTRAKLNKSNQTREKLSRSARGQKIAKYKTCFDWEILIKTRVSTLIRIIMMYPILKAASLVHWCFGTELFLRSL